MNFEHPTNFTILTKFNKIEASKELTNHFIYKLELHDTHQMHLIWKFNKLVKNLSISLIIKHLILNQCKES